MTKVGPKTPGSDIVKLNLGGQLFETTLTTLSNFGENFLTQLCAGDIPSFRDANGYFFIDKSGVTFGPILEFLRAGTLVLPPHIPMQAVLQDADYFSIDLSPAFWGSFQEGLYMNDSARGLECLYFERHETMPWLFGVTGLIDEFKGMEINQKPLWRELFTINGKYLEGVNFRITHINETEISISQTNLLSKQRKMTLKSVRGSKSIDLRSDSWWIGKDGNLGYDVSFCNIAGQKWVLSMRTEEDIVGPFDCTILSDKFFSVSTTRGNWFWMLLPKPNQLFTWNPICGRDADHEFVRWNKGTLMKFLHPIAN